MTSDEGRKPEGAPERSPKAGVGAPSGVDGNGPKLFSVQRKMAIVARLLRGEPLDLVALQTRQGKRLRQRRWHRRPAGLHEHEVHLAGVTEKSRSMPEGEEERIILGGHAFFAAHSPLVI